MAGEDEEPLSADQRARRSAARTALNVVTALIALAVLGAWGYTGFYQLEPGQAAIILQFGAIDHVENQPGLRWHWPPPVESHEFMPVDRLEREEFGGGGDLTGEALEEATMQTKDNNVVHLGFVVQYKIGDPVGARFRVAERREILRDAAQAAMREVVGRTSIDGVLAQDKGNVQFETMQVLQKLLEQYQTGIDVTSVQLQEVQAPPQVRGAFADVIAAAQDRDRQIQEARGYENEVVPRARGEAAELGSQAEGYKEAKVAEARGEAARFESILVEYQRSPEVTRKRLYLEAMEQVLPKVNKVIVEPGTATVFPYVPVAPPPPPVSAPGALPGAGKENAR